MVTFLRRSFHILGFGVLLVSAAVLIVVVSTDPIPERAALRLWAKASIALGKGDEENARQVCRELLALPHLRSVPLGGEMMVQCTGLVDGDGETFAKACSAVGEDRCDRGKLEAIWRAFVTR
jgi:hypothetical protein